MILELTGLEPGKTYVWHIAHGACATRSPPEHRATICR